MRVKSGFMLREIAGQAVVVPLGERVVEFNGIITLSESGALLWSKMETEVSEDELVGHIVNEYDIDPETARKDIEEFIDSMRLRNLID